jgi:DNA-binding transcriptional LysR family regulator
VAAGVGVALIADLALTNVRDDIVVRDLGRDTPIRRISAATLADGYRAPATQAMLDILQDVASRYESSRSKLALVG